MSFPDTLSKYDSIKIHRNNFDSLRFLFASFVIITHSFALVGNESMEFVSKFSNGQFNLSYIGLRGFFIISGFLIYQSVERSKSIVDFIWKRFLRVFPALLIVSFITAFIIGPLISSESFENFFTNNEPYLFFINSVDLFLKNNHTCLPGVFINNPHGCEVNGSLWTITYEFLFYIGLISLFVIQNKNARKIFLLVTLIFIYMVKRIYVNPYIKYEYYIGDTSIGLKAATDFGCFFILGSIFASLKFDKLSQKLLVVILIICSLIFALFVYKNLFSSVPVIIVPIVLSSGLLKFNLFPFLEKTGDISYGTYLYGFPVQQILLQYFHPGAYGLMVTSLIVSSILGFLSWNLIEKRSLAYKDIFAKKIGLKKVVFGTSKEK